VIKDSLTVGSKRKGRDRESEDEGAAEGEHEQFKKRIRDLRR